MSGYTDLYGDLYEPEYDGLLSGQANLTARAGVDSNATVVLVATATLTPSNPSPTALRLYERLPEFYRTLDAQNNYHLWEYVRAFADQLGEIDTLAARITYIPPSERSDYRATLDVFNTYYRPARLEDPSLGFLPIEETSDLLDARTADVEWLPFIGQLRGISMDASSSEMDKRTMVIGDSVYNRGSRASLIAAASSVLTGEKYVRVYPHRDGANSSLDSVGTQWDTLLVTKSNETPDGIDLVAEVTRQQVKPAGVALHHLIYSATWQNTETVFPTWDNIEQQGFTWANIELGNADLLI